MKRTDFDPNGAASENSGIFGLPFTKDEAQLIILPVPWEATTSYRGGASRGPGAILEASRQIDLYDHDFGAFYQQGIFMEPISHMLIELNAESKLKAQKVIHHPSLCEEPEGKRLLEDVNEASAQINLWVADHVQKLRKEGKFVGILGGDHSVPFGGIKVLAHEFPDLGILHFDAHADLRHRFEGFEYSHASIMHNVIHKTHVQKLVQVGVRDYCEEEKHVIAHSGKVTTFFDRDLTSALNSGKTWKELCHQILRDLPDHVYVSFDIDGLDPALCPNTGTPVPGGLSFNQACDLFVALKKTGRRIVGFDLNEVSPGDNAAVTAGDWDANVGARILFKLCGLVLGT